MFSPSDNSTVSVSVESFGGDVWLIYKVVYLGVTIYRLYA